MFYRYLNQIKELKEGRLYKIIFDDDYTLEFDDQELYTIIIKVKSL